VRDDLKEMDFGIMEGLTIDEIRERYPEAAYAFSDHPDAPQFAFPGGESRPGFHQRMRDAFAEIIAKHPGEHVIVVAHGGILGVAIAYYMTGDTRKWRDYVLANCSISRLTVQEDEVTLHCVNDVSHLADLTPEEEVVAAVIEASEEAAND
jgi:broad specificity phosphatase PhoE